MGLSKKIRYLSHRTWVIEAIAMIASVGCLSGIVAILATMHNCRLSDWGAPFSVTAAVSALITASKSTLLLVVASCISQRKWKYFRKPRPLLDFDTFDGASRGPLGALELLFGKAAHAKTAALGALITTIALAWDPSAQLLIEFETQSVANYDPRATFGYSRIYDSGLRIESDVQRTTGEDKEMLAAIINSLYGKIPETLFSCPTGKCDWDDEYTTLGFHTQSNRVCGEGMSPGALYCNITTPGGVVLKNKDQQGFPRTALNVSSVCLGDRIDMQFEDGRCDPEMLNTSTVATFAVYRHSTVYPFDYDSPAPPWEVIECNISLAALTHTGISVRNNSFHIRDTSVTNLIPDQVPSEYWTYGSTQEYLNFTMHYPASQVIYPSGSLITFKINDAD
ncbi:hypothetical protein BS50DRAFT_617516 [Corynespora cassiicola Philippines]|uniref:Uncharacterized protein n=1 Tax=Corynespora cassiicola Philippines TaxID=1448308 RepID=A0A2T2P3F5_CORCC|nr:hypothetical protein BS50DRAFT_617516 [Corynespora cassiicola Philippines]